MLCTYLHVNNLLCFINVPSSTWVNEDRQLLVVIGATDELFGSRSRDFKQIRRFISCPLIYILENVVRLQYYKGAGTLNRDGEIFVFFSTPWEIHVGRMREMDRVPGVCNALTKGEKMPLGGINILRVEIQVLWTGITGVKPKRKKVFDNFMRESAW